MYPETSVFLVCFSLTDRKSLLNVSSVLVPEIKHYSPGVPFLVVGLKEDLRDQNSIAYKEGHELSMHVGAAGYMECSAKLDKNVHQLFEAAMHCALFPQQKTWWESMYCVLI
eukprot:Phypoly_transcript_20127.p1 GENE.Phypoly_transcript_20127~~Phypoly_transcript_20127.p1  ORF type:complete len:112 (+),score=11.01 Phypoly_transcript_20127:340-675(+)